MALIQPIVNSNDQYEKAAVSIRQLLEKVLVRDKMVACFIEFH